MKCFKKRGFWVFYIAIILAGAFIVVTLGLQNQSPVIPDVSAQVMSGGYLSTQNGSYNQYYSSNMLGSLYVPTGSYIDGMGSFGSYDLSNLGSFFGPMTAYSHPTDLIQTIMTCTGCPQTKSTCNWKCGPTHSYCPTSGFCPSPTGTICPTGGFCPSPTGTICPTGGFCPTPTGTICPTGGFCPTPTGTICPTGGFCPTPTGTICPTGGFCPTPTGTICPTGGFCPSPTMGFAECMPEPYFEPSSTAAY